MKFQISLLKVTLWFCIIYKTFSLDLKCGYESCHITEKNKLNVHLVPHSHDDVGWLKTVDQYFYGLRNGIHNSGVQYILDSVIAGLLENTNRRFIQVETAYFWKWWKQQTKEKQDVVRALVNSGRLEIVSGAWSMNDEAITNYQAIIDQFALGLKTINDTLGTCGRPRIGWQIDPFGHTREMASIFAHLGFDGVMFARLDYRDVNKRQKEQNMEFVWRGNPNLGENSDLFTSVVYRFYDAPATFCWDVVCGDEPIIDDEDSPHYNVKKRVDQFIDYINNQTLNFKTNNILITMGGDFTYQAAQMYYKNIDKLIKGFQQYYNETYNLIYSTPSCYIHAVNEYANSNSLSFSLKTDDFIPYASDKHSYWTGYYTSRPNSKRFEREAHNLLQVTKQLAVFEKLKGNDFSEDLTNLKEIVGIMQHHDAITGTEKQHVTDDYVRLLTKGIRDAERNISEIIHELLRKSNRNQIVDVHLVSCLLANVTSCNESNSKRFVAAVYNPLSRVISHYVRLPVIGVKFNVSLLNGTQIKYQVTPSIDKFDKYQGINGSRYELVFKAENLPPLGLRYYYVEKLDKVNNNPGLIKEVPNKYFLGNEKIGFDINNTTGLLTKVTFNNITFPVSQNFFYYKSANGTNAASTSRASGAYIFRPAQDKRNAIVISKNATIKVYSGELFDEVHQQFNDFTKQIIRVYKDENHLEFNWLVGPLEYREESGIEVISRYSTDINSNVTFYTDSNGRGLIERKRGERKTFEYTNEEPVSGNYYPITSRIVIKDSDKEFVILNDRAQGGTSLKPGEVELMLHRRLMNDDNFGVNEVLNEMEFNRGVKVFGKHCLIFGIISDNTSTAAQQHDVAQRKLLAPWTFVGESMSQTREDLNKILNVEFSEISQPLPDNVQILTLEPWSESSFLLRLEHIFEIDEDPIKSRQVVVNLQNLFKSYQISSIQEMTLGGNQKIEDNQKLIWKIKDDEVSSNNVKIDPETKFNIILKPMQIRTFVINIIKIQHSHSTTTTTVKSSTAGMKITLKVLFLLPLLFACFNNNY